MREGCPCCGLDFSTACTGFTKADILANAGGKDRNILRHYGNAFTHLGRVGFRQRHTIHQHTTGLRIVIAHHQRENRGFAGTGRADNRNRLTGLYSEADTIQRRRVRTRWIREMHLIEADLATRRLWQSNRVCRGGNAGVFIENFCKPFRGTRGLRKFTAHFRKRAKSTGCKDCIKNELAQRSCCHCAGKHITRAEPEHGNHAGEDQENRKACQNGACFDGRARREIGLLDSICKAPHHHILVGEGLQRAHGPDLLTGIGIGMCQHILRHA